MNFVPSTGDWLGTGVSGILKSCLGCVGFSDAPVCEKAGRVSGPSLF